VRGISTAQEKPIQVFALKPDRVTVSVADAFAEAGFADEAIPPTNVILNLMASCESGLVTYFFCCYRKLFTQQNLFETLLAYTKNKDSQAASEHLLKRWIAEHWDDFKSGRDTFLPLILENGLLSLAELIRQQAEKTLPPFCVAQEDMFQSPASQGLARFMNLKSAHIAEQITQFQQLLWSSVTRTDVFLYKPPEKNQKIRPNNTVDHFISNFNTISAWAQASILTCATLPMRTQVAEKLIEICEALLQLRNFNAVFAIFSAFNTAAVYRLTHTLKGIRTTSAFKTLTDITSPAQNFQAYRNALEKKEEAKQAKFIESLSSLETEDLESQIFFKKSSTQQVRLANELASSGEADIFPDIAGSPIRGLSPSTRSPRGSGAWDSSVFKMSGPLAPTRADGDIFKKSFIADKRPGILAHSSPATPTSSGTSTPELELFVKSDGDFVAHNKRPTNHDLDIFKKPACDDLRSSSNEQSFHLKKLTVPEGRSAGTTPIHSPRLTKSKAILSDQPTSPRTDRCSCIPHIAMLLTDLVHLTDGMPSKKGEFPNYQKYFTMGKAIYDVFSAGSRPYAFATDKKLHEFFSELCIIADDDLYYETSLWLEPRSIESRPNPSILIADEVSKLTPDQLAPPNPAPVRERRKTDAKDKDKDKDKDKKDKEDKKVKDDSQKDQDTKERPTSDKPERLRQRATSNKRNVVFLKKDSDESSASEPTVEVSVREFTELKIKVETMATQLAKQQAQIDFLHQHVQLLLSHPGTPKN